MLDRLNVVFHWGPGDEAYCLLAVRGWRSKTDKPAMQGLLNLLMGCLEHHSNIDDRRISFLAADVVSVLTAQAQTAHLLLPGLEWPSDVSIKVWYLDQEEYWLSCAAKHESAFSIEPGPYVVLDGFSGNLDGFKRRLALVDWSKLKERVTN